MDVLEHACLMDVSIGESLLRSINCFCGKKTNILSFNESTVCLLIFKMSGIKHSFWIDVFVVFKVVCSHGQFCDR